MCSSQGMLCGPSEIDQKEKKAFKLAVLMLWRDQKKYSNCYFCSIMFLKNKKVINLYFMAYC